MEGIAFDESIIMTRFIAHNRSDHHIIYQNGFVLLCFVIIRSVSLHFCFFSFLFQKREPRYCWLIFRFFCVCGENLWANICLFILFINCARHTVNWLWAIYSIFNWIANHFVCFLLQVIFQMNFPFVDFANAIDELVNWYTVTYLPNHKFQ